MANYNGILGYAMQMIKNNPNLSQNPNSQAMIQAIESGDEKAGIEMANNILQSYGLTKEQGLTMAFQRLNFPRFGGR